MFLLPPTPIPSRSSLFSLGYVRAHTYLFRKARALNLCYCAWCTFFLRSPCLCSLQFYPSSPAATETPKAGAGSWFTMTPVLMPACVYHAPLFSCVHITSIMKHVLCDNLLRGYVPSCEQHDLYVYHGFQYRTMLFAPIIHSDSLHVSQKNTTAGKTLRFLQVPSDISCPSLSPPLAPCGWVGFVGCSFLESRCALTGCCSFLFGSSMAPCGQRSATTRG